jgi:hypothetical protein
MVARPRPEDDPDIADEAPTSSGLTAYDYAMLACYLRLLDAEAEGADWREVASIVLNIDPDDHYDRAKRTYDSHMARAHWMTERGFSLLLCETDQDW